jgi:hypothetical protein
MISRICLFIAVALAATLSHAFVTSPLPRPALVSANSRQQQLFAWPNKKSEDFSDIESRDMTREEMVKYNKASEDIMNAEIIGMTVFSLVISVPLLYLVWVGLFAETAGIVEDF